jgi:hypothetical protein
MPRAWTTAEKMLWIEQTRQKKEKFPCVKRGTLLGTTKCELPGCRADIKVFSCALLQECTLSPNVSSKPYCGTCNRREPPPTS